MKVLIKSMKFKDFLINKKRNLFSLLFSLCMSILFGLLLGVTGAFNFWGVNQIVLFLFYSVAVMLVGVTGTIRDLIL